MTTTTTTVKTTPSAITADIVDRINTAHQRATEAAQTAVEAACECGQALIEAKTTLPHGEFQDWVRENCTFSIRMAQKYMKVAKRLPDLQGKNEPGALLTIADVLSDQMGSDHHGPGEEIERRQDQPDRRMKSGKAIEIANETINILKKIPRNDPNRERGFEIVENYIENSSPQGHSGNKNRRPSPASTMRGVDSIAAAVTALEKVNVDLLVGEDRAEALDGLKQVRTRISWLINQMRRGDA